MPEHPSPSYLSHRRRSIPNPLPNGKDTSTLLDGHSLPPRKSADSFMYSASASAPATTASSTTDLKSSRFSRLTLRRSRDHYQLQSASVDTPSSLTQRIRKFSFSRSPDTPTSPRHPPINYTSADVVMTNTINKDYDPATGNKIINKYMILREIGRGVHGKVKLAEDIETGEYVAIKIVDKRNRRRQLGYSLLRGNSQNHVRGLDALKKPTESPHYKENEQKIRREIAILKKCVHPHVVRLREVIDDPASRKIYMALEYMEGGEIEWRDENEMPVLSVAEARSVFRDVVSGLDYLHYQGIIHRDIKPANLLLTGQHVVKISDFGVSYFNELLAGDESTSVQLSQSCSRIDRDLAETAGTPAFFAPELCSAGDMPLSPTSDEGAESVNSIGSSTSHRPRITKAIDVWALGVTLYCLIFGRCPFTAATEFELFDIIPTEPLTFPDPKEIGFTISDELRHLLIRLLTKNPEERITLEKVKHHPWVIEDLDNPEAWWEEADPRRYKAVEVTDEEVTQAVTIVDRIRKSFQKLSSSFSNLTHGMTRHRSKSASSSNTPPSKQQQQPQKQHQHQQSLQSSQHLPDPSAPTSITPLIHGKPSHSTSTIPRQPSFGVSHEVTRPHSDIYPSLEEEDEGPEYEEASKDPVQGRPSLRRQTSSGSSSSGLPITIRRYRGGPVSKIPPPLHLTSQK